MGAGRLDGVRQTAAQSLLQHQTIHHQLDGVLFVLLGLNVLRQVIEDAVHPNPGKALLPGILQHLLVLALLAPDHRRENQKPGALPQGLHPVHNLVDGLAVDLLAALGAVGYTHPGPQQPQIVIDFRHGAHGGAWVFGGGFLVNGDGGRQAVNGVHIRLIHLPQKLTGVGAEALHISPLALGVDGIKGQAGLAGAGQTGEHHQLVSGNGQADILQIVLPCALNSDGIVHSISL